MKLNGTLADEKTIYESIKTMDAFVVYGDAGNGTDKDYQVMAVGYLIEATNGDILVVDNNGKTQMHMDIEEIQSQYWLVFKIAIE